MKEYASLTNMQRRMQLSFLRIILVFTLFISAVSLNAQPFVDIFNLKYQYFPSQHFEDAGGSHVSNLVDGNILFPLVQKNQNAIILGGFFRQLEANTATRKVTVFSTGLQSGYELQWKNKKWKTLALIIPKISSDEISFSNENIQVGGVVLFKYRRKENLQYNFGIYYNRELFGNYFLPILGINWKATDRINLFGNLPAIMSLEYKLDSSFYAGLTYATFTNTYRIHDDDVNRYLREGDKFISHTQLKVFLNWYATRRVVFFAEGGITYKRKFKLYNENHQPAENLLFISGKTGDGFFASGGLAYRIRLNN